MGSAAEDAKTMRKNGEYGEGSGRKDRSVREQGVRPQQRRCRVGGEKFKLTPVGSREPFTVPEL